MNPERSFSFSRNDDTQYHSSYRGAGGYRVASGASYIPEDSRDNSSSPISSLHSSTPDQHSGNGPRNMVALDSYEQYRQQARQGPAQHQSGYPVPSQDNEPRTSAYRRQRQEASAATNYNNPSFSRRPLPGVPQPEAALDGQPHSMPMPPIHARPDNSYNARPYNEEQAYSDSRPQDPFNEPMRERNYSYSSSSQSTAAYPNSHSSQLGVAAAAASNTYLDADRYNGGRTSPYSPNNLHTQSADNVYRHSVGDARQNLGTIDPTDIEDDEDPFSSIPQGKAKSSFGKGLGARDSSGTYDQVPGGEKKSEWLKDENTRNRRLKWMVAMLIVVVIVLAIVGGSVGAALANNSSSSSSSSSTPSYDSNIPTTGRLTKDSPSIKALLNDARLHRVFPGMDYTPPLAQYPDCLSNPVPQNFVTADVAILSQLTPVIRLYGTDCDQTQMVLTAIKDLGLTNSMKIWGGIYYDGNSTTNARQERQMYEVLDKFGASQFEGLIVGNEVLFSQYMTADELISKMNVVRAQLRKRGMSSLKVATGDLGSNWDAQLAQASDVVMANVHPFFGGVEASKAAEWTYTYWQNSDASLVAGIPGKSSIIAETGWPSSGGNDCTTPNGSKIQCNSDTQGAVAGIEEMNTFLGDWVCSSLKKGTEYFWFEAFDEPWKVMFDTKNEHWESKWGLFDVNRRLKSGVKIPSCGGQTATLRR